MAAVGRSNDPLRHWYADVQVAHARAYCNSFTPDAQRIRDTIDVIEP